REEIERWRNDYNTERPHRGLRQQTPEGFAQSLQNHPILPRKWHNFGIPVTTNTLLERGSESVRDATVIQVVDVIIEHDALRIAASKFGPTLSATIDRQ